MSYKKTIAGPFGAEEVDMTPEEITARQAEEALPQPVPVASQLDAIFGTLTPETQADLAPLKAAVKLELEQGRIEIVVLIIQRAQIPEELEPVRHSMLEVLES